MDPDSCPGSLDRVWYHLFPLGALGAERHNPAPGAPDDEAEVEAEVEVVHRLPALVPVLDRLVDLGAGGLLLGPIFESETHGYDTVDPFRIDRRLGDEADLVALADACQERGLALMLDGVFNHVGRGFPRFADVVRDGPGSPSAAWFHIDAAATDEPDGFGYAMFEGHPQLVALDHANEDVVAWATDVVTHWADRGVDGWRLDAAYAISKRFLAAVIDGARGSHPDLVFVGEVIHGDYAGFVERSHVDTVTQYELWKAIWSSINDGNLFELSYALGRHAAMVERFRPWTFVGNHDTTHLASRIDDPRHVAHAVALLLLLPGTPAIYAGDEVGAVGVKRDEAWGDDDVRRPPPPVPDAGDDGPARERYDLHRRLIAVRRAHPWLASATVSVEDLTNTSAVVVLTGPAAAGSPVARLALNLGDAPDRAAPPHAVTLTLP
jgi:cyclomaltodextrinase